MATITETTFIPLSPPTLLSEKTSQTTTTMTEVMATTPPETKTKPAVLPAIKFGREQYKYSSPLISERAIDQPRPLKVIYIGAGVSGILAAIKFRKAVPEIDLVIYEKNPELGGTWYENRYPGCACGENAPTLRVCALYTN